MSFFLECSFLNDKIICSLLAGLCPKVTLSGNSLCFPYRFQPQLDLALLLCFPLYCCLSQVSCSPGYPSNQQCDFEPCPPLPKCWNCRHVPSCPDYPLFFSVWLMSSMTVQFFATLLFFFYLLFRPLTECCVPFLSHLI